MNLLCRAGCIALAAMLLALSFASCAARKPNDVPSTPEPTAEEAAEHSEAPSSEPAEGTASVATPEPTEPEMLSAEERELTYPSRGVYVPAVICLPEREAGMRLPLAVILHGHGGTNEGLAVIARALMEAGVASIRMDFSGCGKSSEPFTENNLTNMKADVLAAISFMEENYCADPERIGLIGYSMGGRASLELCAEGSVDPYAMLLIAPAASTTDLIRLFGGEEAWERMKAEAGETGESDYNTGYVIQRLGPEFFRAIEAYEDPSDRAAENFTGRALVVLSTNDFAVLPAVSQGVAEALGCETLVFDRDGHSYGLYGPPEGEILSTICSRAKELFK